MNAQAFLGAISWVITIGAALTAIMAERKRREAARHIPAPVRVPVKEERGNRHE
jgi:hypothetical protein